MKEETLRSLELKLAEEVKDCVEHVITKTAKETLAAESCLACFAENFLEAAITIRKSGTIRREPGKLMLSETRESEVVEAK